MIMIMTRHDDDDGEIDPLSGSLCPEVFQKFLLVVIQTFDDLAASPRKWAASLLKQGRMAELADLKASTKAGLGSEVQDVCNGVEILVKLNSKESITGKLSFESKNDIKEAMIALTQLKSLRTEELLKCMPDLDQRYSELKNLVTKRTLEVAAQLNSVKDKFAVLHNKFVKVTECCISWEFDSVRHLIENSDSENGKLLESEMGEMVEGRVL